MDILIILLIVTPPVLAFCSSSIPTSLFIFKMFFRSLIFGTTLAHQVSGNNKINCIGSREVGLMV